MIKREYGKSGIMVSALGFGGGHIGGNNLSDMEVENLLNQIVDMGINLIDTARGYDKSEERIGKFLSKRRDEIVISTKVGYGIEGYQDWTYDCIIEGVNTALRNLKTDYIDIVHLHSCDKYILERGDVLWALQKCVDDGKIKIAAYSGENENLSFAVSDNRVKGIQCSVNICDQLSLENQIKTASEKGMGVIAKRPLANAPWKYNDRPYGAYVEEYWGRFREMNLQKYDIDWSETALRFTAFQNGVSSCIVGSSNIEHIIGNVRAIEKGRLSEEMENELKKVFREKNNNWMGQV